MAEVVPIKEEKTAISINPARVDRKSTRLNSSHTVISYAVFCLKKKKKRKEKRKKTIKLKPNQVFSDIQS